MRSASGRAPGPAGLILVTIGIAAGTFALGTLIYTVTAIALAPQVVMFVGLTHATIGLDHVRPGGDRAPDRRGSGWPAFRMFGRGMLLAIVIGWLDACPRRRSCSCADRQSTPSSWSRASSMPR